LSATRTEKRAVVFDCDGLLLDTEECWTRGEEALFAAYGREFTPDHKRRLLGASGEASGHILASVLDQPGRERELTRELLDLCWGEVVGGARPRPGAREIVEELRRTVPIGVASNSPRGLVEAALGAAGLDETFDVVLGLEDVRRPKPDAEIYLSACERLGAEASRSVALEDSPTGAAAARAAGMYVIGVPSYPGVELDADEVALSLDDPVVLRAIRADHG
jgi:beta-phosphoglucomutase-like phosphatase (HAD superfamily)